MEAYTIVYQVEVTKVDIPLLDRQVAVQIIDAIVAKLTTRPELFGKPLRESLRGYRSLRVGDYRVVYRCERKFVKIFGIGHRQQVYKLIERRIK